MLARVVVAVILPFVLIWTFIETFWREVRKAPWYAWNACMSEIYDARRVWRSKSMHREDWK